MTVPPESSGGAGRPDGEAPQGPVVRDRRRLDPETGQVREAQPDPAAPAPPEASSVASAEEPVDASALSGAATELAEERLADLQRLQAEYVNYRRRVERDRDVARDSATMALLEALLPVLDDVELARQHGDLEGGPFAAIADKLEAVLGRFGLVRYGQAGEVFDPTVHEALMQQLSAEVEVATVTQVVQPGYTVKERVLRAARVGVTAPE